MTLQVVHATAGTSNTSEQIVVDRESPAAALVRAEHMMDVLRTSYVCDGWQLSEPAAALVIQFCRRRADGKRTTDAQFQPVVEFFHAHGQCLNWLFMGDVGGMITSKAALATKMRQNQLGSRKTKQVNLGDARRRPRGSPSPRSAKPTSSISAKTSTFRRG
ncbi:hypothetical protein [Tardiphaga sp.]|uniref:hypothetical protein n=1 Tax=Tardiphaga sp. TaxID=1926292 RepID=UPI00261EF803|nr:hypothetical protein [Tardiphaga sp.]MDB5620429.1 hypothetical protein [Tardiphaga sp.]